jgi:hypothetical protein
MEIEWKHPKCIICLKLKPLTEEHVILDSLGGILTSRFLCMTCNSCFGAGFEAKARLAPELRKAAVGLDESLFELKEKLERGALYKSEFGGYTSERVVRKDGCIGTTQLEDGSLIVPELDAPKIIKSIMQKSGVPVTDINKALANWERAPAATVVNLGAGVSVRKWTDHPATPLYTEAPLSPLVPLKVAYEFAALLVGSMIYRSEFQHIRDVLIAQDNNLTDGMVTYNWASRPDAFHGIAFEGNQDVAQFQVRFFGLLAYTVRFPKIAIKHPRLVYTHRLDTGEDWVHSANDSGLKPDKSG